MYRIQLMLPSGRMLYLKASWSLTKYEGKAEEFCSLEEALRELSRLRTRCKWLDECVEMFAEMAHCVEVVGVK